MQRSDRVDPVVAAVVVVGLLALVLRLVGLGGRPFHWDEARVGVWTLRLVREGTFEYRPVAGGPLPYLLARPSLALFGATDAAARLPIALVGGVLPLGALLLRGRLRDDETVVLALVLAASPALVYYGRFLRGDLLLAGAAFLAVVFGVRALDTGRPGFAYGACLAVAASLAASGFVVGTLACLLGGLAVVLEPRRLAGTDRTHLRERLRTHRTTLARAVLLGLLAVVFLYAPRGSPGASLWSPTTLPGVLRFVFEDAPGRFFAVRIASRWSSGTTHELLPYVGSLLGTLGAVALPTLALAVFGALHDRYLGEDRPVVALFTVWGGLGLLVFPAIAEVDAPWTAVHVLVPLAVPAAVGGGRLCTYARAAFARGESTADAANAVDTAAAAAVLLLVVAGGVHVGGVLAGDVYAAPSPESDLAQYAQPADPLHPFAANVSAAASNDGMTVLYYGDRFHTPRRVETAGPPAPDAWGARLPLPWYVLASGGDAESLPSSAPLPEEPPPVVVAGVEDRRRVATELRGYRSTTYRLGLWNREVAVFVRSSAGD